MIRLFQIIGPASLLVVLETAVVVGCYTAVLFIDPAMYLPFYMFEEDGIWRVGVLTALILSGLYFRNLYSDLRIYSRLALLQELCLVMGWAFIVEALLWPLGTDLVVPRKVMIVGSALTLASLYGCRLLFNIVLGNSLGACRVLFLGASPAIDELIAHFTNDRQYGLMPVGRIDPAEIERNSASERPVEDLLQVIDGYSAHWIALGDRKAIKPWWTDGFLDLRFGGVHAEDVSALYERTFRRVILSEVRPVQVLFSGVFQPNRTKLRFQAAGCFVVALAGLIVSLPLFGIVMLVSMLTGRKRVFVREQMAGSNGKRFTRYRFGFGEPGNEGQITPAGRLFTRWRLNSLPTLWNVLRGEMSIVGPRPMRPEYAERLAAAAPIFAHRHSVKPGLICLAHLEKGLNREGLDAIRELEYDLYYVKHLSLSLDLLVMLRFARNVLAGNA